MTFGPIRLPVTLVHGELKSARIETEDARMVTAGPLPTAAMITGNDIAVLVTVNAAGDHKRGTDISP
jgi:hypothetical protein